MLSGGFRNGGTTCGYPESSSGSCRLFLVETGKPSRTGTKLKQKKWNNQKTYNPFQKLKV